MEEDAVSVRNLNEQIRMHRMSAKAYAQAHGYFWSPCPICGTEFGGHEWGDIDGKSSTIWEDGSATGTGICPQCTRDGKGNNPGNGVIMKPVEPEGMQCWCGKKAKYAAVAGCFESDHVVTQYYCPEHAHKVTEAWVGRKMYCSACHRKGSPWNGLVLVGDFLLEEFDASNHPA
jgi:hypothetical protein